MYKGKTLKLQLLKKGSLKIFDFDEFWLTKYGIKTGWRSYAMHFFLSEPQLKTTGKTFKEFGFYLKNSNKFNHLSKIKIFQDNNNVLL